MCARSNVKGYDVKGSCVQLYTQMNGQHTAGFPETVPHLQHHTVNHSVEFVSRTTGVHTHFYDIESYWNRVKIEV